MPKRRSNVLAEVGSSTSQKAEERLFLIDSDAGTDDAWALFMALAFHKAYDITGVKILGITTNCGNTTVEHVSNNVTRTLNTVDENSIPIYQGMSEYIANPFTLFDPPYHGEDGFGDADLPPISSRIENEHAVNAIIRLAEQYKDKLSIIALGPLTNLAIAVKLKPEIKNYIKKIYILGGNMDGLGNTTAAAEFNFLVDPEAAAMCVDSYPPCKLIILPWETAVKATSTIEFRKETLGTMNTSQIQLLNKIEARHFENLTSWMPPDAVIMACALDTSVIMQTVNKYAKVEVNGTHTRGMLVVDKDNILEQPPNITLITELNKAAYENYLVWAAGGESPSHIDMIGGKRACSGRSLCKSRNKCNA